ncbi:UDP-glycosyltransferase 708G1-like [Silene latifolia]|uniref:UDP-glycosyltransferase 708G1-like n=1 Tax=Silene latifolia TaxID=37657 RepID=UPI003D785B50
MSHSNNPCSRPHIALIPSSGMGHLTPFLRLAVSLTPHDVQITLITAHPTVSLAESDSLVQFSRAFPQVMHKHMLIPSISNNSNAKTYEDPFTVQYEAIRRSSHILSPLLSSLLPPVSAVITDMSLTSMVVPITKTLNLPNYILFTTCAKMLAIYAYYHKIAHNMETMKDDIPIPGLPPIPKKWLPPLLLSNSNNLLKTHFIENGENFVAANGVLVNTFEELEKETLAALNSGLIVGQLPPVISIGPLIPSALETGEELAWLNDQPCSSVLYICFGTRAAISRDQMREIGIGMVKSEYKFLWVVKGKQVDREDEDELQDIVGHSIFSELKQRGLLVNKWIKQEQILSHRAIGGFISHCGWNSVTEAVWYSIPILAWPQNADQKINADLVRKNMVGKWDESWGWGGRELVDGTEIAQKVEEMMEDKLLRGTAEKMRNKARLAVGLEGSSHKGLTKLIHSLS